MKRKIIYIKYLYIDRIISIELDSLITVKDIKEKTNKIEDLPIITQRLFYLGKELEDKYKLDKYNIKKGSTLIIYIELNQFIYIKTIKGELITIGYNPKNKIIDLKCILDKRINIPINRQRLFFAGKELEDNKILKDYKIKKYSIINLFIELRDFIIIQKESKKINIQYYPFCKIIDIKKEIIIRENILLSEQTLVYNNSILDNNKSLSYYNINKDSIINLYNKIIVVKDLYDDKQIILPFSYKDRILDIKIKIKEKEGISVNLQALIFKNKELNDYYVIGECDENEFKEQNIILVKQTNIKIKLNETIFHIPCYSKKITIKYIKYKIKELKGFPVEDQSLFFKNIKIEDDNIPINKLYLEIIPIFIKILSEKTIILYFKGNNTIRDIKEKIQEKKGIPIEKQRLTTIDKELEDSHTLSYYNIDESVILYLKSNEKNMNDKEKIKELNKLNEDLLKKINQLEKELNDKKYKNIEIVKKTNEIEILENNKKVNNIKEEIIQSKNINYLNQISIIIMTENESNLTSLICNNNDRFSKVEEMFYDIHPEFSETENNFFINGKKIKRNKSLLENQIYDNSIVIIKEEI